jgi:hypothetical protein
MMRIAKGCPLCFCGPSCRTPSPLRASSCRDPSCDGPSSRRASCRDHQHPPHHPDCLCACCSIGVSGPCWAYAAEAPHVSINALAISIRMGFFIGLSFQTLRPFNSVTTIWFEPRPGASFLKLRELCAVDDKRPYATDVLNSTGSNNRGIFILGLVDPDRTRPRPYGLGRARSHQIPARPLAAERSRRRRERQTVVNFGQSRKWAL